MVVIRPPFQIRANTGQYQNQGISILELLSSYLLHARSSGINREIWRHSLTHVDTKISVLFSSFALADLFTSKNVQTFCFELYLVNSNCV